VVVSDPVYTLAPDLNLIPPTAVGGSFQIPSTHSLPNSANPTHGSGWFVSDPVYTIGEGERAPKARDMIARGKCVAKRSTSPLVAKPKKVPRPERPK